MKLLPIIMGAIGLALIASIWIPKASYEHPCYSNGPVVQGDAWKCECKGVQVCGLHVENNLQILVARANLSKRAKWP